MRGRRWTSRWLRQRHRRDDPGLLFNVTNGLIIGAFYVLMALGLSLILNLSNVINFAHGNFLALGGYLAFTCRRRWVIGVRSWSRRCLPR